MRSFFKQPNEKKSLSVDFTPVLSTGEVLNLSNPFVTIIDVDDGSDVTSTILDFGSTSVDTANNLVAFRLTGGTDDKYYKVTVNTGSTNQANQHEEDLILVVTEDIDLLYSVDELKDSLEITDTAKDTLLYGLIRAATDYIEKVTDRKFTYKTYIEDIIPEESDTSLIVKHFPLEKVDNITIDGTTLDENIAGTINYTWDRSGYIRRIDGAKFPRSIKTTITYTAGFKFVPEDVRNAVKKIAISEYSRRLKHGILAETIGSYRIVFNRESELLLPLIHDVVSAYKKRKF